MSREITEEELKSVSLHILEAADQYCREHQLTYYLFYGTLLGAARHKGFIPWDDDVDIAMPRKDYEQFIRNFSDDTGRYRVISSLNTPDLHTAWAKIIDTSTELIEDVNHPNQLGVFVDVFPLDYLPGDTKTADRQMSRGRRIYLMMQAKQLKTDKKRHFYKNCILIAGRVLMRPFSYQSINRRATANAVKYNNVENPEQTAMIVGTCYREHEVWDIRDFQKTAYLPFEGKEYPVPGNYDDVLKVRYGDYMTLPPEEERKTHHMFKAYWKDREKSGDERASE